MAYTDFFYADKSILFSITKANIRVQSILDFAVSLKDKSIRCSVFICFQSSSSDSVRIEAKIMDYGF